LWDKEGERRRFHVERSAVQGAAFSMREDQPGLGPGHTDIKEPLFFRFIVISEKGAGEQLILAP
jgi:hypothetical protein